MPRLADQAIDPLLLPSERSREREHPSVREPVGRRARGGRWA